jgi:hypothetical protein
MKLDDHHDTLKMEAAFLRKVSIYLSMYVWLYSPCGPWSLFQFLDLYTVGWTPWTADQPVTKPLPTL